MSLTEAKQIPLRIQAAFWSLTLGGHHSSLHLAPETGCSALWQQASGLGLDLTPGQTLKVPSRPTVGSVALYSLA